ncbi:MAG: hypothetical protein J0I07_18235 [Myxococcales bacterium]|nr:hypothetical protein [Myxococcales bacterium]
MPSPATDVIHCPLCNLPCRMAAAVCDGCGQDLHAPLNLAQLRDESAVRKREIVLALFVIVVMLVLNVALFEGAAYVVLLAPFGWLGWTWIRLRALSQRLARASANTTRRSGVD